VYFAWIAIAFIGTIDAIWLLISDRTVAHLHVTVLLAAVFGFTAFICNIRWPRITGIFQCLAQNFSLPPLILIFAYLCATVSFPLRDDLFAAADRLIGFEWGVLYNQTSASRLAMDSLAVLYYVNYVGQTILLLAVLPFVNVSRNTEFIVTYFILAFLCILIAMFLPAKGPIFYFNIEVDPIFYAGVFASLKTFIFLREETVNVIDVSQFNSGIVAFPSFHAGAAILFSYAMRGSGRLFRVASITNALMLLAIPIIGDHYLIDVIAGVLLASALIILMRKTVVTAEGSATTP
jgi:hypothetical protein